MTFSKRPAWIDALRGASLGLPSEFHELIQSIASFSSVYVLQRGFGKTFVDVRVDALVGPFIWKRHATNATRFATASRLSLLRLLRFILRHVKK